VSKAPAGLLNHPRQKKRCAHLPFYGFISEPRQATLGQHGQREMNRKRLHIFYSGRVQGVGFRYTVKSVACGFDITGVVRNLPEGRVELVAEGERFELEEFKKAIQDSEVGGLVRNEEVSWNDATGEFRGFEIGH
jgi:acylphosphatase